VAFFIALISIERKNPGTLGQKVLEQKETKVFGAGFRNWGDKTEQFLPKTKQTNSVVSVRKANYTDRATAACR
jgi:hypothetical protein